MSVNHFRYAFRNALQTTPSAAGTHSSMGPRGIDERWVRRRLDELELGRTHRQVADHLHITPPRWSETLKGSRRLQAEEAPLLADLLKVDTDRVLQAFGLTARRKRYGKLLIEGYVDAATGRIIQRSDMDSGPLEEIDSPFPGYSGQVVRVKGSSMSPRYRDGEIIAFSRENADITHLVGHEAIVATEDGRLLLKVLHPGDGKDHYTLISLNPDDAPILNVRLAWAAAVDWHIPRRL